MLGQLTSHCFLFAEVHVPWITCDVLRQLLLGDHGSLQAGPLYPVYMEASYPVCGSSEVCKQLTLQGDQPSRDQGLNGGGSVAGLPAIVVPCGVEEGSGSKGQALPVGLQIIGRGFGEADIINFAHIFEQTIGLGEWQPTLQ